MIQKAFKGYEWMYETVEEVGHQFFLGHCIRIMYGRQPSLRFNGMYTVILKASPRCGAVRSQGDFLQEI